MSTLDDVLSRQKTDNVLYPPTITGPTTASLRIEAVTENTLTVGLLNSTTSSNVYAYITGLAIANNHCLFLLEADGETPYYPTNPDSNGSALSSDCAIALGAPGITRSVTIPYIAGGRIWFCVDNKLTFLLNSSPAGPGLVEPSVSNTADPNYHLSWDFCEFTYNSAQLYANITYVDFVCLPISLTLTSTSGTTSHVGGLPSNGLETICTGLQSQNAIDSAGWDKLVITNNGTNLRALSPSNGILFNPDLFSTYWDSYIDAVWTKYISSPLTINTQFTWGSATGYTSNDRTLLTFSGVGSFPKPSAKDIFGANSGAFAPQDANTDQLLNIGARLDAAFNRSTLLINADQPTKEVVSTYYGHTVTNHYARIVHAANVDGRGYCFPYDDVTPEGRVDQSGFVNDGSPKSFLVCVGGGNAFAKRTIESVEERGRDRRVVKRGLLWQDESRQDVDFENDGNRDLEKGLTWKLSYDVDQSSNRNFNLPPVLQKWLGPHLTKFQSSPIYIQNILPLIQIVSRILSSVVSLSIRTLISRVFIIMFFVIFYLLGLLPHGLGGESQRRVLESVVAGSANGTALV
ncbi:hypothetical protein ONS95_006344 [Cadophora gregata]|uniref:uncharacterized protein n=1 Tax=Cadophora gregata TaxID=51156 RepID=UPI0026DB0C40|nr:uncharacterized protein ONS95_006344 [Cadophora gregata]KAK0102746.1 hypothetical protein ONS95_006344 [Cadophora gregata]